MTNADTFKLAILYTIYFYFNSQPWIMCAIFYLYHLKTEGGVLETPFNQTTTHPTIECLITEELVSS